MAKASFKTTILWRSIAVITVELVLFFSLATGTVWVAGAALLVGDFAGRAAWAFSALLLALATCATWFALERRMLEPELRPLRKWSSGPPQSGPPTAGAPVPSPTGGRPPVLVVHTKWPEE